MTDEKWMYFMEKGHRLGCHQMPERSFFIKGYQFPVCARCTGVLAATVVSTICFLKKPLPVSVCAALSSVMLADWMLQEMKIKESTNKRRLITGLIGGFGYTQLHLHLYAYLIKLIVRAISQK